MVSNYFSVKQALIRGISLCMNLWIIGFIYVNINIKGLCIIWILTISVLLINSKQPFFEHK